MTKITVANKGESVDFVFDRGGESISGFVCTIFVKEFSSDSAIITRVVEPDSDSESWSGFLTSSETDLLTPGTTYRFMAVLASATTGEQDEIQTRLSITATWAA